MSPILACRGKKNIARVRWVGGFSQLLPFKTASFDYIFCNAALHHMHDIPEAISEMLRVLRPGGYLFTTCDSYRMDCAEIDYELKVFNNDPVVLLRVNEQIPRFKEYVATLEKYRDRITPEIFT
jgi:ubiquinone/menaquinone biosynthesis C-methylase UbiE